MNTETLTQPIQFNFRKVWNDSLQMTQREPKERNYIYASEFSKSLRDRYLAMKGVPPSNLPNERSYRKFFSGNVWNFVAGMVLHQLGIVRAAEQVVNIENLPVPVHGRLDYLVGGVPQYEKARAMIKSYPFEPELMNRFLKAVDNFEQMYGNSEIETLVHEIKSCSEFVIDMIGEGGRIEAHVLQLYHYLKGLGMPRGVISYISKNDSLMEEVVVNCPDAAIEEKYISELENLKKFLDKNEEPPLPPLIVWEGKFKKNLLGVEYSSYLTHNFPQFKEPHEYSDSVKSQISRWNRVLKRLQDIKDGKRGKATKAEPDGKLVALTANNLDAIKEMDLAGWDAYDCAAKAKVGEEEDENE